VFSFTEGFLRGTRQKALCRVPEIKHSAKNMTLGKEPNSGSVLINQFRANGKQHKNSYSMTTT
jgi:hypothetical protein